MSRDDWTGATIRLRDGRLCYVQDGRTRYLAVHTEDNLLVEVDRAVVTMTRPPIGYEAPLIPETILPLHDAPWWARAAAILAVGAALVALIGSILDWWTW